MPSATRSPTSTPSASSWARTTRRWAPSALDALQFPQEFVQAVFRHHDADGGDSLLGQIIVAGEALAVAHVGERSVDEPSADLGPALAGIGLSTPVSQLLEDTAREVETLSAFLN